MKLWTPVRSTSIDVRYHITSESEQLGRRFSEIGSAASDIEQEKNRLGHCRQKRRSSSTVKVVMHEVDLGCSVDVVEGLGLYQIYRKHFGRRSSTLLYCVCIVFFGA